MSHKYAKRRAEFAIRQADNLRKQLAQKVETIRILDQVTAECLSKHEGLFAVRCNPDNPQIAMQICITQNYWSHVRAHGPQAIEQQVRVMAASFEAEFRAKGLL